MVVIFPDEYNFVHSAGIVLAIQCNIALAGKKQTNAVKNAKIQNEHLN